MSRIAVTGSSGFIGSALVRLLEERGHAVLAYDHPQDVRDIESLRDTLFWAEGVIHLAGALGTTEIFGAEGEAVATNIGGAVNVYDVAAEREIPVVQIGTGHKGQPNPYAITKAAAEELGLARARYLGEKVNVVRAFHVYGPGQKPVAPFGKGTVRKIIPDFVCRALVGMDLEVYGSGEQRVDLVYVDDVAKVLLDALEPPYGRVLEAGTGVGTTVNMAARRVLAACGSRSQIAHVPMRDGEPPDTVVVAAEPQCRRPWPYKLEETIDWCRDALRSR